MKEQGTRIKTEKAQLILIFYVIGEGKFNLSNNVSPDKHAVATPDRRRWGKLFF